MNNLEYNEKNKQNSAVLEQDFLWIHSILKNRIDEYINSEKYPYEEPSAPNLGDSNTFYADFLKRYNLNNEERKILLLSMSPSLKPEILDDFIIYIRNSVKPFTEFGGLTSSTFRGFIPTIKTALFLLGGCSLDEQLIQRSFLSPQSVLFAKDIIKDLSSGDIEPDETRPLRISESAFNEIITGKEATYNYSYDFPANNLKTKLSWDDLILCSTTKKGLEELLAWLEFGNKLIDDPHISKRIQPGYRALFYGPPGTGKTLCASLIGKKAGRPVYRINISRLVSKFVGETEKNLEKIFKMAEGRDWILFFDEAESLFSKRTDVKSANDRFANQETAYLLQRIETYNNLVILATNKKKNFDEAFSRRFQSIIPFMVPREEERLSFWQETFSNKFKLAIDIDLNEVAYRYKEITGADIVNITHYCSLMAASENKGIVSKEILMKAIVREFAKYGRTVDLKNRL